MPFRRLPERGVEFQVTVNLCCNYLAIIRQMDVHCTGVISSGRLSKKPSMTSPSFSKLSNIWDQSEDDHLPILRILRGISRRDVRIFRLLLPKHQEEIFLISFLFTSWSSVLETGRRVTIDDFTSGCGLNEDGGTSETILHSKSSHSAIPNGPLSLGTLFIAILWANSLWTRRATPIRGFDWWYSWILSMMGLEIP